MAKTIRLLEVAMKGRKKWQNICQVLKERNYQPRILCPAKIPFRLKRKSKHFCFEKLRESVISRCVLK